MYLMVQIFLNWPFIAQNLKTYQLGIQGLSLCAVCITILYFFGFTRTIKRCRYNGLLFFITNPLANYLTTLTIIKINRTRVWPASYHRRIGISEDNSSSSQQENSFSCCQLFGAQCLCICRAPVLASVCLSVSAVQGFLARALNPL